MRLIVLQKQEVTPEVCTHNRIYMYMHQKDVVRMKIAQQNYWDNLR